MSSRIGTRLDATLELVVFRLVQEALANIRKHAQAQHAWIWLERQGDKLRLEVRDDGCGFAVQDRMRTALATGHIGLASMAERAETAGGTLTIESTPTQGTVLRFVLPFRAADDSGAPPESPPPQEPELDGVRALNSKRRTGTLPRLSRPARWGPAASARAPLRPGPNQRCRHRLRPRRLGHLR